MLQKPLAIDASTVLSLLSVAFFGTHALVIFPGTALTVMVLCNGAVWQISAWLSALWQPAHQSAAPKCHMPSPWRASCPAAVSSTPSVLQGCSGHRQVGMHPRAVVHSSYSSIKVRGISTAKISCAYSQLAARQAQFHPVTQLGVGACNAQASFTTKARSACSPWPFPLAPA